MAFDGSIIAAIVAEYKKELLDGRIVKIAQPEKDELLLTIKKDGNQNKILISSNPSLPITYITKENKTSPLQAPTFCMLLRKHILNGKITKIYQPTLERIIEFEIEHFNEMGDLCKKILTIELMGKHSNIIFRDSEKIIDSIKRVSILVSSVREVLPGKEYFIPFENEKKNPLMDSDIDFESNMPLSKYFYSNFTGISPSLSEEICFRAGVDSKIQLFDLSLSERNSISDKFNEIISIIKEEKFKPNIVYDKNEPVFFGSFEYQIYSDLECKKFDSISEVLFTYYNEKQKYTNIRQKTSDLRQSIQTILNKDYKKYDIQLKQIKDTEKKDKYKLYGELITVYGYGISPNSNTMTVLDYYSDKEITIPLDPTISVIENGKKYYEKYSKMKRTFDALDTIVNETKSEIDHLESILTSLDIAQNEADISEIKKELIEYGYIKVKSSSGKKGLEKAVKSIPLHFVSSDGFDIYVGKNNYQNEYISFKLAEGNDWWFHAKKIPGSHVIVKSMGKEVPDSTFEDAARLAAHFSKAEGASKVEVDYIQKKHLKKPTKAKAGFVIYHTNFSMTADTDISKIKEIN